MGFAEDVTEVARLLDIWAAARSPLFTAAPHEALRVGDLEPSGWGEWRMIPSRVTPADVDSLEGRLGVRLPPFYRAFLCCRVVLGLEFGYDYSLPSIGCDDPLRHARLYLEARVGPGFTQFASANGCGDPVCFDLMRPTQDSDCPIVVFNHDAIPPEAWGVRADLEPHARIVAPSFRAFLTSLLTRKAG